MELQIIDTKVFTFKYLPEYAMYLLVKKLEEFVTDGIRFSREMDLPMLKPLAKIPEKELVKMSLESNKLLLKALSENKVADHIKMRLERWTSNQLGVLDKSEIVIEDITLGMYVRRKLFASFMYGYNQSASVQQLIVSEVDLYTSQEELLALKAYMQLLKENR